MKNRSQLPILLLKALRKIYRSVSGKTFPDPKCILDRQQANDVIYEGIVSGKPLMMSRFGSGEMNPVVTLARRRSGESKWKLCWQYITDNTDLPWMDRAFLYPMENNAGVFPASIELLYRFAEQYMEDLPLIDILLSFNYKERFLPLSKNIHSIHLEAAYPFFVDRPWTRALRGKRVLVIHPCVDTIKMQYAKRRQLFSDPELLPDFELLTIRAVQSACGERPPFPDWFAALEHMEHEIDKLEFDVAILGCGAYGLPLAAYIKRKGRQALHMGGGTQLLFGIKGKRWEENYIWTYNTPIKLDLNYKDLYNEYWVRPLASETPEHIKRVEGGCYW